MGTGESQLAKTLGDMEGALENQGIKLAYLPSPGSVRIRLTAEGDAVHDLEKAHGEVLERLSEWVVSEVGLPVEEALGHCLVNQGQTLAVAESCTGGALGAALVARPGASAFFHGWGSGLFQRGQRRTCWAFRLRSLPSSERCLSRWLWPWPRGHEKSLGPITECRLRALLVRMAGVRISQSALFIWLVTVRWACYAYGISLDGTVPGISRWRCVQLPKWHCKLPLNGV